MTLSTFAQQFLAVLTNAYLENVPPDNGPVPMIFLLRQDPRVKAYYNCDGFSSFRELETAGFLVGSLFHPSGNLLKLLGVKPRLPDGRVLGDVPSEELEQLVWEARRAQARAIFSDPTYNGKSIHEK